MTFHVHSPRRPAVLRRRILATTVVAVASLSAVTACSSSGGGSSKASGTTSSTSASAIPTVGPVEKQLIFMGPSGKLQTEYTTILQPLLDQYGVTLKYEVGTAEAGYAQILAGERSKDPGVDLININDKIVSIGKDAGVWAPLNKAYILSKDNLDVDLAFPKAISGDPPVGVRLAVVPQGLMYNKTVFAQHGWAPPTKWSDLVDPKYASCVVPLSPSSGLNYLEILNKDLSGDYLNVTPTLAAFKKIAKQVPSFATTNAQDNQLVEQGTGCLGPTEQASALTAAAGGAPVAYVSPTDGAPVFGGQLGIPVNAPDPNIALLAITRLLSVEGATAYQQSTFFPTTNKDVPAGTGGPGVPSISEVQSGKYVDPPLVPADTLNEWVQDWNTMTKG
jgi:putative spermidine/putrescine transport system substrate-binding protein